MCVEDSKILMSTKSQAKKTHDNIVLRFSGRFCGSVTPTFLSIMHLKYLFILTYVSIGGGDSAKTNTTNQIYLDT